MAGEPVPLDLRRQRILDRRVRRAEDGYEDLQQRLVSAESEAVRLQDHRVRQETRLADLKPIVDRIPKRRETANG